MMEAIKVKYLVDDLKPIEVLEQGDWIDLRVAKDINLVKGDYYLIPLGVAIQLPKGYEALCVPRSSTFKIWGIMLANSIGVIDESYCGDSDQWHFPAYATKTITIPKNTRICQFRIIKHQPKVSIQVVDTLGNEDRGGIGSTGKE